MTTKTRLLIMIAMVLPVLLVRSAFADDYIALLNSGQEVPPRRSGAVGVFTGTYNKTTNMFHYQLSFNGLVGTESAAHIHGPAEKAENASVLFGIVNPGDDELGTSKFGFVGPFTEDERDALNRGLLYINVHSSMFPGGEIRGQIYRILRK